ncbi:hypothetical protein BWQ96_02067 [Gracilariopsis chorda]|uniref:Uncharacterized protein n=1 Tax=Gracilariopsis chorda TaxID=448386 RepID=A0A2V3J1B5_9FLOR|nr:hypothetical protein BWQ96_02067 [Gracilariopsis chorda]|eukprot:PXF48115.1 hypothetical protein BWQ96_02067 [Gracilariopsis chorda]
MRFHTILFSLILSIISLTTAFPSVSSKGRESYGLDLTPSYYHPTVYPSKTAITTTRKTTLTEKVTTRATHPTTTEKVITRATTRPTTTEKVTTRATTHPTTTENITTRATTHPATTHPATTHPSTTEEVTTRATTHPTTTEKVTTRATTHPATTHPTTTKSTSTTKPKSDCPNKCVHIHDAVQECKGLLDRCYIRRCSPSSYRQLGQYSEHTAYVNGVEISPTDLDISRHGKNEDEYDSDSYNFASCEDLPSVAYSTPEPSGHSDCVSTSLENLPLIMDGDVSPKDDVSCFEWCYGGLGGVIEKCYQAFGESLQSSPVAEALIAKKCCENVCKGAISSSAGSYTCETKRSYH